MPRYGVLTFGDLISLGHLEIASHKCDRLDRYSMSASGFTIRARGQNAGLG
jgi:hypothetical protein